MPPAIGGDEDNNDKRLPPRPLRLGRCGDNDAAAGGGRRAGRRRCGDDDAAAGGGPRTTTMTAITTTTTTNDADAITGRAVRAGPDVEWTKQEGCLFVMGGGEVLRFFECHNIIFSYGICHGHPAPRKNIVTVHVLPA